jgi:hypothetical protein
MAEERILERVRGEAKIHSIFGKHYDMAANKGRKAILDCA